MSPTRQLRRVFCHFLRSQLIMSQYSSLQRLQKLSARNWILRHLLREYRSGLVKLPGSGRTALVLRVSKWLGVIGSGVPDSVKFSTVKGRQFTMASVSTISVRRDSSSNCVPCSRSSADKTDRTVRISLSHTPPMWEARGTFMSNLIQSHPFEERKLSMISLSSSCNAVANSFRPPTKLDP